MTYSPAALKSAGTCSHFFLLF